EGAFRYGKRHGRGVLVSNADGTERYEGEFRSDFPEGAGRKVWPNGASYDGQWREGRKDCALSLGSRMAGVTPDSGRTASGMVLANRYSMGRQAMKAAGTTAFNTVQASTSTPRPTPSSRADGVAATTTARVCCAGGTALGRSSSTSTAC
ncbi:unnamed protein product, partial [Prorocentrum cordatum]